MGGVKSRKRNGRVSPAPLAFWSKISNLAVDSGLEDVSKRNTEKERV